MRNFFIKYNLKDNGMSKEKSEKWLNLYPNYKAYFFKKSLPLNVLGGVLFYLLIIRFDFNNLIQIQKINTALLYLVFMLIIHYFLLYKPNKKIHEYNS
ncbi:MULTISPECIES: hypothetical protein [Rhodonellum]|nr:MULTISPECIES: hypothetical protein [Rhodonellum]SDY62697.1 hypothetical protein SAMN05444412_10221 [Rhodonellum ikkaensis]